jgi:hypothetical protein
LNGLYVIVGHVESRFRNPLHCCKLIKLNDITIIIIIIINIVVIIIITIIVIIIILIIIIIIITTIIILITIIITIIIIMKVPALRDLMILHGCYWTALAGTSMTLLPLLMVNIHTLLTYITSLTL